MAQVDFKKATVKLKGGGGSEELEITFADGDMGWTEKKNRDYTLNRGSLAGGTVRDGDDEPVDVKIDALWDYVNNQGMMLLAAALKGTNGWTTSSSDVCEPYSVDIEITYEPGCGSSSGQTQVVLLPDFRHEQLDYSLQNGTINVTGKCNVTEPTITGP